MKLLDQTLTFEIDYEHELYQIISDYENNGWEMRSRSPVTPNRESGKLNVTIHFKLKHFIKA